MPRHHKYCGLVAATWDLLRGDTSHWPDRAFYRDIIRRRGQPALDVGCGTGRLLLDYLAEGIDIDGVDISQEMIEFCLAKAQRLGLQPAVFQQAVESLDLPRRYRTIIIPSSTFQLITDPVLAIRAIGRLYAHLAVGGVLVMPFMIPRKGVTSRQSGWKLVAEQIRPGDGAVVRRWSRADYDMEHQMEHTEDRYEVWLHDSLIASEHHRRSPATRWYAQPQAVNLFQAAGFVEIRVFHAFTEQPASEHDDLFSVMGTKPPANGAEPGAR